VNNEEGGVQMKKLIVCLAILAFVGYAQAADVLVGNFEGTNDGWADTPATQATGWSATVFVDDPIVSPSIYEYSADWSTVDSKSLKASVNGWVWSIRRDVRDVWWDHDTVQFDMACIAQDGSTATWAQVERLAGSWQSQEGGDWNMDGTNFGVGLDGETVHVSYNYAAYKGAPYSGQSDAYGSLLFTFNSDAPVYLFIDNIMFTGVPEPATISLLGLGGLALLRRKK
jgi:hypothetical protein